MADMVMPEILVGHPLLARKARQKNLTGAERFGGALKEASAKEQLTTDLIAAKKNGTRTAAAEGSTDNQTVTQTPGRSKRPVGEREGETVKRPSDLPSAAALAAAAASAVTVPVTQPKTIAVPAAPAAAVASRSDKAPDVRGTAPEKATERAMSPSAQRAVSASVGKEAGVAPADRRAEPAQPNQPGQVVAAAQTALAAQPAATAVRPGRVAVKNDEKADVKDEPRTDPAAAPRSAAGRTAVQSAAETARPSGTSSAPAPGNVPSGPVTGNGQASALQAALAQANLTAVPVNSSAAATSTSAQSALDAQLAGSQATQALLALWPVPPGGQARAELKLNPDNLGQITVALRATADGQVSATITCDLSRTHGLLEAQAADLAAKLGDAGINVTSLDVRQDLSQDAAQYEQSAQRRAEDGQGRGRNDDDETDKGERLTGPLTVALTDPASARNFHPQHLNPRHIELRA